jgi:hypothetical protein
MNQMDFLFLSCFILAFLITIILFLKFGRPSNWFKSYKEVKG